MRIKKRVKDYFSERRKKHLLQDSKVFCMSPWIQLHAQTNGKVSPCCMSSVRNGNEIGDLRENPDIAASWNSENMKKLRSNMLKGKKNSLCNNCYKYEKLDKFSERMQYNQDATEYFTRIANTMKDGTLLEDIVPIIDIRFSNKCNYKCRICSSDYSTLWYEDELRLAKEFPQVQTTSRVLKFYSQLKKAIPVFQKIELSIYRLLNIDRSTDHDITENKTKEIKASYDELIFWNSLEKLLSNVKRLHFAGGEPLFMDEHYRVLEYLIKIRKTDVNLTYNTNLSTLRYKRHYVIEYWKQFERVDVWASLDGMGSQGDYQRKGQKWDIVEGNIRTIQAECPNLMFGINVTTSILNIFHVPSFYKHLVENKFVSPDRVNLYLLFTPSSLSVTNLSPELKKQVEVLYKSFKADFLDQIEDSQKIKSHINAVLNLMNSKQDKQLAAFKNLITSVDKIRDENFLEVYPELKSMFLDK